MRRGFILGAICGSLASLAVLGLVSVLDNAPGDVPPSAQTDAQPLGSLGTPGTAPLKSGTQDSRPQASAAPQASVSGPDSPAAPDTDPAILSPLDTGFAVQSTVDVPTSPQAAQIEDGALMIESEQTAPMLGDAPALAAPQQDIVLRPRFDVTEAPVPEAAAGDPETPPQGDTPEPTAAAGQVQDPAAAQPAETQTPSVADGDVEETEPVGNSPADAVQTAGVDTADIPQTPSEQPPNTPAVPDEVVFVPAVEAFAVPFALEPTLPIVSFVLLDGSGQDVDPRALAALPFPVTVAVDASTPDVMKRSQAFADLGIEVAVTGPAPIGGDSSSVESAYFSYVNSVPTAVAVVGGQALGLRGGAARLSALRSEFLETGHGYLAFDQAASSQVRSARSAGIPAAIVFRDLDGDGQSAKIIRRFADQATRQSRKEGIVILLARLTPDTVLALTAWGTKDRSETHNIAPLSAALLAGF